MNRRALMARAMRRYSLPMGGADIAIRRTAADATHAAALRNLNAALVAAGVWPKLDALVVETGGEAGSLLNIVQPRFDATNSGMTYTAGAGFMGNGTDAELDTNLWLGTPGLRYSLNSAHAMFWSNTAARSNNLDAGGAESEQLLYFAAALSSVDVTRARINAVTLIDRTNTDGSGMFVINRPSATVAQLWRNGAQLGIDAAVTATSLPDVGGGTIRVGGMPGGAHGSREFRAYSIGAGLTPTEIAAFHAALLAYWSAIYDAPAADFDGTNDYLTRGAGLTGAADGSSGLLSFWFRLDGGDGSAQVVLRDAQDRVAVFRQSGGAWRISLTSTDGLVLLRFDSANTYLANGQWHHLAAAWNTNAAAGAKTAQLYIDGAADRGTPVDAGAAFSVDYTDTNWSIGASPTGGSKFNGALAEFYLNTAATLDLSSAANLQKFRTSDGRPAFLGANGSIPTGSAPIVYLRSAAASFGTNSGTGGDFTVTGSLDAASTSPSD